MKTYNSDNQKIALQFFVRFFNEWDQSFKGQSVDYILKPLGLTRAGIINGREPATISLYYRVLQIAAHSCQHNGFFIRLGNSYDIFDLGILGYALISSANLQRSWELSSTLLPHPINTKRHIEGENVEIQLSPQIQDQTQSLALCEEWLVGTWRWTCQRLPQIADCTTVKMCFKSSAPDYKHLYTDIFPGTVAFEQPVDSLSFPVAFNEIQFSSASSSVSKLCFEHSISTLSQMDTRNDLINDVRRYLLESANISQANINTTAHYFAMPAHTFRRRISQHETTFKAILLEARMVLSKQYLQATELSINEISYLTGYEHPPSFYRAFQKYYATSPEAFRKNS